MSADNPSLKITLDDSELRSRTKSASEFLGKTLSDGIQKGVAKDVDKKLYLAFMKPGGGQAEKAGNAFLNNTFKGASKTMGGVFGTIFGGGDLKKTFTKNLEKLAKDQALTQESKRIGDVMAGGISKAIGVDVTGDQIAGLIRRSQQEAEKRPGIFERLLYGKEGKQKTDRGIQQSFSNMAFQQTMSHFGTPGAILGAMPQHMQSMGIPKGLAFTGLQAAGAAVGSAVNFGMGEREHALEQMAPVMGGRVPRGGYGKGGAGAWLGNRNAQAAGVFDVGLNKFGLSGAETAAIAHPLGKAGAAGAFEATAQAGGLGMGGEMSEYFATMSGRGKDFENPKDQATVQRAQKELQKVMAAGISSGLTQGRWGEVAQGMSQLIKSQGISGTVSTEGVSQLLTVLGNKGEKGGYQGAQAFQATQGIEGLAKTPGTALGRAVSLNVVGGLQEHGNLLRAQRRTELGFFGQKEMAGGETIGNTAEEGMAKVKETMARYKEMAGIDRGTKIGGKDLEGEAGQRQEMVFDMMKQASHGALSSNDAKNLYALMEKSGTTAKDMKTAMDAAKPLQDKAFQSILDMSKGREIDKEIKKFLSNIYDVLLPGIKKIIELLQEINKVAIPLLHDLAKAGGVTEGFGEKAYQWWSGEQEKQGKEDERETYKDPLMESLRAQTSTADIKKAGEQIYGAVGGLNPYTSTKGPGGEYTDTTDDALLQQQVMSEYMKKTGKMPRAGKAGMDELRSALKGGEGAGKLARLEGEGQVSLSLESINQMAKMVGTVLAQHMIQGQKPATVNLVVENKTKGQASVIKQNSNKSSTPARVVDQSHAQLVLGELGI